MKLPALPEEPEVIGPSVAVINVDAVKEPVTDKDCPRVDAVLAALMLPAVSENTAKALAVDAG
ncbi:hypothetical protein LRR18_18630, partial [Mangrovimonas sp. AS39]|uniref:hypothetical protein n=1 Tax=Mangrovimonas futianensis TaxID=2895523 RepID=UPI001E3C5493